MSRKLLAILLAVMMIVPSVLSPAFADTVTYTTAKRYEEIPDTITGYSNAVVSETNETGFPVPFHLMSRIFLIRKGNGAPQKHASISWTSGGFVNFGFDLSSGNAFVSEGFWNGQVKDDTNFYSETPFALEENTYYQIDWFVSETEVKGYVNGAKIISYAAPETNAPELFVTNSYIISYPTDCDYDILDTVVYTYDDSAILSQSKDDWNYENVGYTDASVNYTVEAYQIVPDGQCEHQFGEWIVSVQPGCTESGIKSRVCSLCGVIEAEYIPPFGHNYEETVIPATCERKGYVKYTCSNCGDSYTISEIPPALHDFGEWTVTTAATCGQDGVESRVCSDCGEIETRVIPATGDHVYVNGVCYVCGAIEPARLAVTDATAHAGQQFTVTVSLENSPGITTLVVLPIEYDHDALTLVSVENLGLFDSYTKGLKYVFDSPENVVGTGDLMTLTFEVADGALSGDYTIKASTNDASDYDYNDVAVVSVAGTVSVTAHDFGEWTVTTPATCTADGVESRSCVCGVIESRVIGALGHDYGEWAVTTPATCTATGVESRVCANDESHVESRVTPALGHNYGDWTVTTGATCVADGVESRVCANDASHIETRSIAATGTHNYVDGVCTMCGAAQPAPARLAVSDATAHAGQQFTVTVSLENNPGISTLVVLPIAYDHDALTLVSVSDLGLFDSYTKGLKYVFDSPENVVGNGDLMTLTFEVADNATAGDYTITASTNDASDYNYNDVLVDSVAGTVSVVDHDFGEWVETTPATCTATGIESRSCACGVIESRVTPVKAHEFGDWVVTAHASCTAEGAEKRYCANCDASEERTLPATGHNYGDWVVTTPATCEAAGVESRVCANDESHVETRAIAATGHSFGEWAVTTPATCGAAGVESRVCANDESHVETRPIAATGEHAFAYGVCTVCGALDPDYDPNAPASPKLTVCDASALPGDEIEVTVSLVNNPGLTTLIVNLDYDHSALTFVSAANGELFESMTKGTRLLFDNYPNTAESGVLATLTFKVADNAAAGDYSVRAYSNDASDEDLVSVILGSVAGTITVAEPQYDPARLVVSSARAKVGEQFTVTVSLEDNPGIAGLELKLDYDTTALTLDSVTNGDLFSGFESSRQIIFDESENVTGNGLLMTLTFTVNDGAEDGEYAIGITVRDTTDVDLHDVPVTVEAGAVEVYSTVYGDVDGNGTIGVSDVVTLRRYLASYDDTTGTGNVNIGPGADVNGDGAVSIKDVVLLRRYLANYDEVTGTSTVVLGPQ